MKVKVRSINDSLAEVVAEELLGYRWMSYIDTPVKETEGYPSECRVRSFFSPRQLKDKRWLEYWSGRQLKEATGDEPLQYGYCSMRGPTCIPPDVSGDDEEFQKVVAAMKKRNLLDKWSQILIARTGGLPQAIAATLEMKCLAALEAVGIEVGYAEEE